MLKFQTAIPRVSRHSQSISFLYLL